MDWLGREVQKYVSESDSVLDLGCGIGSSMLDTCDRFPPFTRLKCGFHLGVDIHKPYIDFLRNRGYNCIEWDLRKIPLPFLSKSFHVVTLLDLLEHLKLNEADNLLSDAERIGRRLIMVASPKRFNRNLKAVKNPLLWSQVTGDNVHQEHKCLISRAWLEERGYVIHSKVSKKLNLAVKELSDPFG